MLAVNVNEMDAGALGIKEEGKSQIQGRFGKQDVRAVSEWINRLHVHSERSTRDKMCIFFVQSSTYVAHHIIRIINYP